MNRTRESSDRSDAEATLAKNDMIMMVRTCGCSIPRNYQIAFELDCFVVADTRPSCQSCRETEPSLSRSLAASTFWEPHTRSTLISARSTGSDPYRRKCFTSTRSSLVACDM